MIAFLIWVLLGEKGFFFKLENEMGHVTKPTSDEQCHFSNTNANWEFSIQCHNKTDSASMSCTPAGHKYSYTNYFSQINACNNIKKRGVKKIIFVGDSFVRHAYEAFLNILTGDFLTGAYDSKDQVPPVCIGDGQFEESICRHHVTGGKIVCGDVVVSLYYGGWPRITDVLPQSPNVIIWGVGNHPIDGNYSTRHGVYNASIVASEVLLPMCHNEIVQGMLRKTKVLWLLQHFRLVDFHEDESVEKVRTYNFQTCKVMNDVCGIKSIDTWTPTFLLSHMNEAKNLTWDGVHWSRTVNILKAHMILYSIFDQNY
jgi:hypothetical protein